MNMLHTNIYKTAFVLLLSVFSMCASAQKVQIAFHAGGVPEEVTLLDSNNTRIGYSNIYNTAGVLTMSLMYKNGVPDGQWSRYDDKTGRMKESFNYVNGKLHGEHVWYDESGKIIKTVVFNNGVRVNYPKADNLWTLEVSPATETGSFRVMGACPTESYENYCTTNTIG
jgi:hypothetical protein